MVLVRTIIKLKNCFFFLLNYCCCDYAYCRASRNSSVRQKWSNGLREPPTVLLAMTLAMHCARPWTEGNYRCDVSFERPLITSRPRAWSYASRERKLWWKKFKIKRFVSGCDEIWDSRNMEGNDKLSTDPLTAILASLDHFYGIYWASSWNGRLQSPHAAFPFFLLLVVLVQLKIFNVS